MTTIRVHFSFIPNIPNQSYQANVANVTKFTLDILKNLNTHLKPDRRTDAIEDTIGHTVIFKNEENLTSNITL